MIKKYTDWSTWLVGLRTNLIKCIGTTGTTWLGTNAVANIGVEGWKDFGLDWQQALVMFGVHIGLEIFSYMKQQQPQIITETFETSHVTRDPISGVTEQGSSKKTTTTPVDDGAVKQTQGLE